MANHSDAQPSLAARIDTLEMRLTYQDTMIEDLNTVIVAQWAKLDQMQNQIRRLEARLQDAQTSMGQNPYDEPPPPHY